MSWALLPLKDLSGAKTRLAGILSASERHALAMAMAEDVLQVLSRHQDIRGVTLLSDDPAAHLLAAAYGADHLPESSLGCRGLNAVLQAATRELARAGKRRMLVLHGDLPSLGEADIDRALRLQRQGLLVIGCDRAGAGTNLLAFDASRAPRFHFGADSCARHLAWAQSAGQPAQVLRSPGLELDVDQPQDLAVLLQRQVEGHTGALMRQWPRQRLELALQSLARSDNTDNSAENHS